MKCSTDFYPFQTANGCARGESSHFARILAVSSLVSEPVSASTLTGRTSFMSSLPTPFAPVLVCEEQEDHVQPPSLKRISRNLSFLPVSESTHLQLPELTSEMVAQAPIIQPRKLKATSPELDRVFPEAPSRKRRQPPPTLVCELSTSSINDTASGLTPSRYSTPSGLSLLSVNACETMDKTKLKRPAPKGASDRIIKLDDSWHCPFPSSRRQKKRLLPRKVSTESGAPEFSTYFLPLLPSS